MSKQRLKDSLPWLERENNYTSEKWYKRVCQGLREIPQDIPVDALKASIRGNPITSLRANNFHQLSQLTYLALGWNEISQIEINTFIGLGALERLFLHDNILTKLTKGMFNGIPNCNELNLFINYIDSIESDTFSGLEKVEILHLHDNRLTRLTQGMFTGLKSLKLLTVFSNSIHTVDTGALSGLPKLTQIGMGANALTTLSWTAFISEKTEGGLNYPAALKLQLQLNPFQCNSSLCWIKQAESDGWLTWWDGDRFAPQCYNFPVSTWSRVNLDCQIKGE